MTKTIKAREHGAMLQLWRALSYNLQAYVARRPELLCDVPWLGAQLRVGAEDILGRRLFKRGLYERGVTTFLLRYLAAAPQDVIFDVGANVGYYSVLAHQCCGDAATIHAIEAEPGNHALLLANLRGVGARVVTHPVAVSDAAGTAELYLWKASNRGKHSLVPFEGCESVSVPTRTIDSIVQEHGLGARAISLLKIDIEGAEHRAFLGAAQTLPKCRVIVSEVSAKFLRRAGISIDEHIALVCDNGFGMFAIDDDGSCRPCTVDELRNSTKSRNVAYLREDLMGEPWVGQVFGPA
ncbi:MAG: FkbM family methyltransferase [Planctomycetes bacterium]|nr:FkbM family methyltransferase [Planctomycetota bacterium]